ncbi:MAG: hypothetical protein RR909_01065 [Bacilli bacterium]
MFKKLSIVAMGCLMIGGLASCGQDPTISVTPVPPHPFEYPFIGFIGGAVGGWNPENDKGFTIVEGDVEFRKQELTFTYTEAMVANDKGAGEFKIRADHSWDAGVNKGIKMFDKESVKFLKDDLQKKYEIPSEDPNAVFKEAGTYKFVYHPYYFLEPGLTGCVVVTKAAA